MQWGSGRILLAAFITRPQSEFKSALKNPNYTSNQGLGLKRACLGSTWLA
jgi:hypothetical protein